MNQDKKLVIINKEKIFEKDNSFYCDNVDLKSIPEGLSKNFKTSVIAKKSNIKRFHKINLENIEITSNIFTFLFSIFKTFKNKEINYLLISITPHTFFAYHGYEEYKAILGFMGPVIYYIMYTLVTFKSNIITCQKRLVKKKNYNLVFPSEIDINWLKNTTKSLLDKPRLLYAGRIKVEKGIFSLLKMFDEMNVDAELSIVGNTKDLKTNNKKINFFGFENDVSGLIKIYDNHNITILPSFTEAHPKVVDESLARLRPVIVFEEINHIIQDRQGLFVSKRNAAALSETIKFIMNNYSNIQENMKKNKLPTKQEFISQFTQILR